MNILTNTHKWHPYILIRGLIRTLDDELNGLTYRKSKQKFIIANQFIDFGG